jgi:hypothetical protein
MSLRPHPMSTVPAETARVAQAVYPKGNLSMTLRDVHGSLYTDEDVADLFPTHGQPAACPWRLALICVLQFAEDLSDRQAAELIASPDDPEARYSTKRSVEWVGDKVHLTETCDGDTLHVIVNVETTPATTPDDHMVAVVHASLAPHDLLPAEHLVDKGYTDAHVLVDSQRAYGVTIVGPVAEDPSWQARAGEGFDTSQFLVDGDRHIVICPAGQQSLSWLPNTYPKNGMGWEVRFARKDCTPCVYRSQCTKARQGAAHPWATGT